MSIITVKKIFKKFGLSEKLTNLPKKIYIFHQKGIFKKIEDKFNFEKVEFIHGDLYIEKEKDFAIITNFGTGFSPALMLGEELYEAGFREIISFGIAGFLAKDNQKVEVGDLFVLDKIYSQINLDEIYKNEKEYLETEIFINNLKKANAISVPTLYKETVSLIEASLEKKISIIEMEAYPLALVLRNRDVKFNQIVVVSDILRDNKWDFDSSNIKKTYDSIEKYFLLMVKNK